MSVNADLQPSQLAKKAVFYYLNKKQLSSLLKKAAPWMKKRQAGVFVTIYAPQKKLRGCIGTFLPTQTNVAQEIINNAIAAAFSDSRFSPITAEEMPCLSFEVSILSPPQPAQTLREFNPQKDGIIVSTADGRRGLLLPGIKGIDSPLQQFLIACQKAGINPEKDSIQLEKFTCQKFC